MPWSALTACSSLVQVIKAVPPIILAKGLGVRTMLPASTVLMAGTMHGKNRIRIDPADLAFLHLKLLKHHLPFRWNRAGWILR